MYNSSPVNMLTHSLKNGSGQLTVLFTKPSARTVFEDHSGCRSPIHGLWIFLPSANAVVERLCFYTCLSFCPRGVSAPVHAGIHTLPGQTLTTGQTSPPLGRHPRQTATTADGVHPTGKHSCSSMLFLRSGY